MPTLGTETAKTIRQKDKGENQPQGKGEISRKSLYIDN